MGKSQQYAMNVIKFALVMHTVSKFREAEFLI